MTATLEVVERPESALESVSLDVSRVRDMSLEELASSINAGYVQLVNEVRSALHRAMHIGELLCAAKRQMGKDEWGAWVVQNVDMSRSCVTNYMRLATYKDLINEALESGSIAESTNGGGSVERALIHLRGMPAVDGTGKGHTVGKYPEDIREEARAMARAGLSRKDICDALGVGRSAVSKWCVGEGGVAPGVKGKTEKQRYQALKSRLARERAARAALRRQERDRAVTKHGGGVAEMYSLIRKAAQVADRTLADETESELRAEISAALSDMHKIEDRIVRALGIA